MVWVGGKPTVDFGPAVMSDEHNGYMGLILGASIGGFIAIIIALVLCYVKRWCCFAVSQLSVFICSSYLRLFSVAQSTQKM